MRQDVEAAGGTGDVPAEPIPPADEAAQPLSGLRAVIAERAIKAAEAAWPE